MTKKHFEALAYCMATNEPIHDEAHHGWEKAQDAIMMVCEKSNHLFNRYKFLQACHTEYWETKQKPKLLTE
jgi:hypothetical protein